MNEELAAEIKSLQTGKASAQHENSKLKKKNNIQQPKRKLRILPDRHKDHVTQLQKQLFEEKALCLEMEKTFVNVWRNMNSTCQFLKTFQKMAQVMNQEL